MNTLFIKLFILIILLLFIKETINYFLNNPFYIKEIIIYSSIFSIIIYFIYKFLCSENENIKNKTNDSEMLDDEYYDLQKDKIEPILQILDSHKSDKFFSIALTAPWGAGKSSTLKAIKKELEQKYHTIYLNTWQLENSNNLLNEIKKEIDNILFKENKILWFKNLFESLLFSNYFRLSSKYISKSDFVITFPFEQTIKNSQDRFNILLKKTLKDKKILLLIDEVDRLHDRKEIVDIFKIIRYTASFDNIVAITALDLEQIEKILNLDIEYIHKIFNMKYQLAPIDKNDILRYFKNYIFPKTENFISNEEFTNLLLNQGSFANHYEKNILEIVPTFRVIKSSFNETYNFVKHLKNTHGDDWKVFISFRFIYIINIIKSMNFKDYNYLITQNNLLGILQLIHINDEKYLENISEETSRLLRLLKSHLSTFDELYLEIYKNYKINDYDISNKIFENILEDFTIIHNYLKKLELKEHKSKFLDNFLTYVYNYNEKKQELLGKVIEIIIKNKNNLNYEEILEKIVIKRHYLDTLVKDENIDKLLNLKEDDDIFKVFINKIFQEFNPFPRVELLINKNTIKVLLEKYFDYLLDKKEEDYILNILNEIFNNGVFIQNIVSEDKNFGDSIAKLAYDKLHIKLGKEFATILINMLYFEDFIKFIENNDISPEAIIDEVVKYQFVKKDGSLHISTGDELIKILNKKETNE
ncbi:KAP family NTPase [Aliarcobacter butzleri]|uniref:KAP family NTPase n=1 Tax=Aliarcobacter butzleri TaxID=28197 RepID=UPI0021B39AFA|nr:KAP family NTPase [Aliarcobacter butzleri]MCT7599789.1 KAP family NTPase [Aliarcobacter butzleri]